VSPALRFSPGNLVTARGRKWIVLPSEDEDLLLLKPLGGSEEEVAGIYLPLKFPEDKIETADFHPPTAADLGPISTARLLYNAARLSFRNGAGPFRSLAKLSFRPRSYQIVPLIMALRLKQVRLLIADDVGVGKTIEALLVAREMLERRLIKRFAVVCLPHLCDQWQEELKAKFDIDAVVIRSNTQARLDREIQGDTSVFEFYPYQVISIDYIKSEQRKNVFISECPELVIVDEAHTCARPAHALKNQQKRYSLIYDLAQKEGQHLVLLTATPHSGKPDEFQSLLGLLQPDYESIDLPSATQTQRRALAQNFIQRKRADVEKWLDETTPFPHRDSKEAAYKLSPPYLKLFADVLEFARKLIASNTTSAYQQRLHYWTALALMRGVMSSPAAGIDMLKHRLDRLDLAEELVADEENPVMDKEYFENDITPAQVVERNNWTSYQTSKLKEFTDRLEQFGNINDDQKAAAASEIISNWLKEGFNPVIFCRYIETAKYLGRVLEPALKKHWKHLNLQVVTSEDPDELRRERISSMKPPTERVLICTDCLSEGINLQELFTAVLHYDLPWNPNRLEQREGRVDRFGQTAPEVRTYVLYGADNPIDGVVLEVILRKVREIRKSIGISMPFPEDSQSILDTVLQSVLLNPARKEDILQPQFNFMLDQGDVQESKLAVSDAIERAAQREKQSRSIFAQNAIHAEEIEADLREVDDAIGRPRDVEYFVTEALATVFGVQIDKTQKGYTLYTRNLPESLKYTLPAEERLSISFESPTPAGHLYLGRNHLFVEQLCQLVLSHTIDRERTRAARASVIRTKQVTEKTTIYLFRVRNVIEDTQSHDKTVAEEMLLWGYRGTPQDGKFLGPAEAEQLLADARVSEEVTSHAAGTFLENELNLIPRLQPTFDAVAHERCEHLVEAHTRFTKVMGGTEFQVVDPVIPMDVMGIYVLVPVTK
jgi:superfamily II DNA or RNA helicase